MLFWAPKKGPSFVNKTKKLHMYKRKPNMLYSISNKLQRVSICLNMLHLFDRTDKNITLVSKKCIILRFRCSLLAINRKHCSNKARPERL